MIDNEKFDRLIHVLDQIAMRLDEIATNIDVMHHSRDFFAAAVISGIANEIDDERHAVRWAYKVADEMVNEGGH
jgi:division protein CdvB (Snf7/Vps24/ESCRT-III family)